MGITLTDYLLFGAAKIGDIDDLSVQIFRRKVLQWGAIATAVDVVVRGVPPIVLPEAVANGIHYINAYGGTKLAYDIPLEYTQVDYATKKGTAGVQGKFDTGIKPTVDDVKIEIKVKIGDEAQASGQTTVGSFYACQARATASGDITGISGSSASGSINGMQNGQSVASGIVRVKDHIDLISYEYKNGNHSIYVKDLTTNTEDTQTGTYTFSAPTKNLYIFGNTTTTNNLNNNNALYYCKIWVSGSLAFDAVPVIRNSDNVVGLYDKVSQTFIEPIVSEGGGFEAGAITTPTPSDPMDIYCNNGALKILDKSDWTIFTNPTSVAGQGVFISADGKWYNANDRGAGCAIPLTIGKQYTLVIHKKTVDLGTILRYGQSPQETPTGAGIQLTDWYRGDITDGMMISFVAKQAYFVMQFSAVAVEAGMIQEAVEVLEAQGSDYTFVDSITASGTQYIDTGILAASDIKAEVKYKPTNTSAAYCALGGRDFSSGDNRNAFGIWANVSGRTRFDFQSNSVSSTLGSSTTNWNIAVKDGVKNYFNGTQEESNDTTTFASTRNMYLFGMLSGSSITGNMVGSIAYCRIWKAGVLVRDFIPAIRNSDSVVGMYDTVSGTFFTNAGTGTFVAGTPLGDGEVLKLTPSNDTVGVANLLKIDNYVDTQEILTGLINHQVGIYVFDGTEDWTEGSTTSLSISKTSLGTSTTVLPSTSTDMVCTHYQVLGTSAVEDAIWVGASNVNFRVRATYATVSDWKTFLAGQHTAGTPVIVVYPLATAQDEVAPVPQTMQTVAGDNQLDIVQAGMSGLEVELKYTTGVAVTITEVENAQLDDNITVTIA